MVTRYNSCIIRVKGDDSPAICSKCHEDKPISEYYVHSERKDGAIRYRGYCKSCRRVVKKKNKSKPVFEKIISQGFQKCKFCNQEKDLSLFYSNGCYSDGIKKYRTRCKTCVLELLSKSQPEKYKTKSEKRSSSPKNFITGILNHACRRKQHLGFNLDLMFLLDLYESQKGFCAISGVEMTYLAGDGRRYTNISIDRIDSSKGYLRDNVQFVCDIVNVMKQQLTKNELLLWCNKIIKHSENDKI